MLFKLKYLLIASSVLVICCSVITAQNRISSDEYYVGTAEDTSLANARNMAYNDLVQKIQVFISASTSANIAENNLSLSDSISISVRSHSSIILQDVEERITSKSNGKYSVAKIVSKCSVRELFKRRKDLIREYLNLSERELSKTAGMMDIGSVLKNYYRAYLLAQTVPDTIAYSFNYDKNNSPVKVSSAAPAIQSAARYVVSNISFIPVRRLEAENIVWNYTVEYKGLPVSDFRFSYFDGYGEMLGAVKNGLSTLEFFFKESAMRDGRDISLKAEAAYEDEMDELLKEADMASGESFGNYIVQIKLPANEIKPGVQLAAQTVEQPPVQAVEHVVVQAAEMTASQAAKKTAVKGDLHGDDLHPVIKDLLNLKDSPKEFLALMEKLARDQKIITGSKQDFESADGLYAVVFNEKSLAGLLKYENDTIVNLINHHTVTLKEFSGMRIKWFELL